MILSCLSSRNGSAKIVSNVIIDKEEEEEDDQFVVEAAPQLPEMTEMAMVGSLLLLFFIQIWAASVLL